ncbi:hypothetical protein ABEW34_01375 [Paenibacillus algorifonticola]|uniref:hypothetical protein n=1 Tax=Paenibacillus algorifonticola TaxID=684063 RepID=UPI003D2B2D2E
MRLRILTFIFLSILLLTGCTSNASSGHSSDAKQDVTLDDVFKKRMNDEGLTLTNKDVQFDKEGYLGKKFGIQGMAELSDYYNYAFRDAEADFFSIRVVPFDGTDSWYLYLSRSADYDDLYKKLMSDKSVPLFASAAIPRNFYEKGQGNLAMATIVYY